MPRLFRFLALTLAAVSAATALLGCGPSEGTSAAPSASMASTTLPSTTSPSTTGPATTSTSTTTPAAPPTTTWIPIGVDCSSQPLLRWDTVPGARPTPEEAVRWWADQPLRVTVGRVLVRPDDEIRLVGDPQAASPTYVSVRVGVPVATFGLRRTADGWQATPFEGCFRGDRP